MVMVVEGPADTFKIVRTLMGATNPVEAAPGTIRGDLATRDRGEPGPRLGLPGVGGPGDRPVLPRAWPDPGVPARHLAGALGSPAGCGWTGRLPGVDAGTARRGDLVPIGHVP